MLEEVHRLNRASLGKRAEESLRVDFINRTNLDNITDKASIIDEFFKFAQAELQREVAELISAEIVNKAQAKRDIAASLKREYNRGTGAASHEVPSKVRPLNPQYKTKKHRVF